MIFNLEARKTKEDRMIFRRNTGFLMLSLFTALFLLSACGGSDSNGPPPATATTGNATGITNVGATLNGTVNPNGLETEAWFEYGTDPNLVSFTATDNQALAAGTNVDNVSASISGLSIGTTYYFRIVASNLRGVSKGAIHNFSVSAQRPTVTTSAADNLAPTSATLHGGVNPNSLATQAWFEYGTDNTLATFTQTDNVGIGSGSAVVQTSANISGLTPGGTVYFRAAASNAAGEQKGTILNFSTANIPPVANAGPDNTVDMGQTVTLNGSGTATPPKTITSYLWTQVAGTPQVLLIDNTTAHPTFTAPTVDRIGATLRFQLTVTDNGLLTSSDNVDIIVKWVGFADDFSTDTTATYTVTPTSGTGGTFTWESIGKRAQVLTGDDNVLKVSHTLPASDNGVFSLDFSPTITYPGHGGVWIRLTTQDDNNYYEIKNFDWSEFNETPELPDLPAVNKVVGGVVVDNVSFLPMYTQGNTYNIKITFSSTQVKLEGFGTPAPVILTINDPTAISVNGFNVETGQQDAYYDNIKLVAHP
jgi:hypothetical protein